MRLIGKLRGGIGASRPDEVAHRMSAVFIFAAALLLTLISVWKVRAFRLDDALIYARYVRNLYEGHGLLYNPGEYHNGITSPLYVWLLVLASSFTPAAFAGVWLGGVCLALTVYLVAFRVYEPQQSPLVGAFAALGVASTGLNYNTLGMESSLTLLLATASLVLYREGRWKLLGVALGLMGIARSELVFLAVPLMLGTYRRTRKLPFAPGLIAIATMLPALLYNAWAYGSLLPDTLTAKIDQGRSGFWGQGNAFLAGLGHILVNFHVGIRMTLLASALSLLCLLARPRAFPFAIIGVFSLLLLAFYTALGVPAYHWYLVPVVWALCLLAPLGASVLIQIVASRAPSWASLVIACVGGLAALLLSANANAINGLPTEPHGPYLHIGKWMRANLPAGSSVGAAEIGHIGWYSDLRIIDICGLVTPQTARFLAQHDVDAWLKLYRPDYVLVHDPMWPMERGAEHAFLRGDYQFDPRFNEPGFKLLRRAPPGTAPSNVGSLLGVLKREDAFVREASFGIGDDVRPGLYMHPPTQETFRLRGGMSLRLQTALAVIPPPEQSDKGDGVTFVVTAKQRDGTVRVVHQQHVLQGAWHAIDVVLGDAEELLLRTEPGPAGDSTYDWAVWGDPKLVVAR